MLFMQLLNEQRTVGPKVAPECAYFVHFPINLALNILDIKIKTSYRKRLAALAAPPSISRKFQKESRVKL